MTWTGHAARIAALMLVAAVLFGKLAADSEVMFNDGLRYVGQARRIDGGDLKSGLLKSVDHPVYPLGIVAAHRIVGGATPDAWERAGHLASIVAGVLWVIPLYLVAVELYGGGFAWLAGLLALIVPVTGQVFADVLSESTFLLWWCWGLWSALRFLRRGDFLWLPLTVALAGLAYFTRPEGLLLPATLVASLFAAPLLSSTRMNWPRWWAAVGFLVIGPTLLLGPYVAMKGGLGTKPAIAKLLGTAPKAAPLAVERQRPLDPNQTAAATYALAVREVAMSIKEGVTAPLLPFALAGLIFAWPPGEKSRSWLFMTILLVGAALALVRLHATGGYCTPRHALVVVYPLVTLSTFGLHSLVSRISVPGRWLGMGNERFEPGPLVWVLLVAAFVGLNFKETLAPLNHANAGYREAGLYLAEHAGGEDRAVDLPGLSLFYGGRGGYTFENLHEAPGDPRMRWVVVRAAHLDGDWPYCERIRELVKARRPVATFPEHADKRQANVYVFDLAEPVPAVARAATLPR